MKDENKSNSVGTTLKFILNYTKTITNKQVQEIQDELSAYLNVSASTLRNIKNDSRPLSFEECKLVASYFVKTLSSNKNLYDIYTIYNALKGLLELCIPLNTTDRLTYDNSIIVLLSGLAKHEVRFNMPDGTEIATITAGHKMGIDAPIINDEKFLGWDKSFQCVTEDMVITAIFEESDNNYTPPKTISILESRTIVDAYRKFADVFTDDVIEVCMCAICGVYLMTLGREYMDAMVSENASIRIIINNPLSQSAVEAAEHKSSNGSLNQRFRNISRSYEDWKEWQSLYPDNICCKITDLFLPCAILIIKYKDERKNTIKVDYYSFNCADLERRCINIHYQDRDNYKFYSDQFEYIWEHQSIKIGSEEDKN